MLGYFAQTCATGVALLAAVATSADAVNAVFKLGKPTYYGSGCPNATLSMVTSFDAQSVSVLFSEFKATADVTTRSRKTCDLIVPVQVLQGITIGIFKADYRGNVYVPEATGAYAEFSTSYFFASSTGPSYKQRWGPSTDTDVYLSNNLTATSIAWSPCKTSTTLRINAAVTAYRPSLTSPDAPEITIDSADVSVEKGIEFFLTYRTC